MRRRSRLAARAVAAGCAVAAARGADAPAAYTLAECLRLGLERATPVAQARRDVEIAGNRVEQVRADVLPDLQARGDYTRLDEVATFDTGAGAAPLGRLDNYAASVEVSQLLFAGGSVRSALSAAHLYRGRSELALARSRAALVRDIRTGFYDILFARERAAVAADSLRQLEEVARQADEKFRAETVSEFEQLSAGVRAANERPLVLQAERDLQLAKTAFRGLVHLDSPVFDCDGKLDFEPLEVSVPELAARALARRPEVLGQEMTVGLYEVDVRAERGRLLPEFRARAAYLGQNPEMFSAREDWAWRWEAGVSATWSLFDGGRTWRRVQQKRTELAMARADLEQLRRDVVLEVEEAALNVRFAAAAVAAAGENAGLAERSLAIARARYDAGLSTYLEFTDANLALRTARLAYWRAVRDHLAAAARLRYAAALPDPLFDEEAPPP